MTEADAAANVISTRDAYLRALQVQDRSEAAQLMDVAILSGDIVLSKAVAEVALRNNWPEVLEMRTTHKPDRTGAHVNAINDALDAESSDHAWLEMNARAYTPDPVMDRVADLIEQGPEACVGIHPLLLDRASIHKDFRDLYRRAVAAGAIQDIKEQ